MSHIRGKNTKLETNFLKRLSASFYSKGIRYRKHYRKLKGSPDIVFVSKKVAVFLDGEFWHGRGFCKLSPRLPKKYWRAKIQENIRRDRRTNTALRRDGWTVLRFWETDVEGRPEKIIAKIWGALGGGMVKSRGESLGITKYYPLTAGRVCAYRFKSPEWPGKTKSTIVTESVSQSGRLTIAAIKEIKSASSGNSVHRWKVESGPDGVKEIRAGLVKWLIRPPLAKGTAWRADDGTEYIIKSLTGKVEVPAGVYKNCLHITYWNEDLGDGELYFAEGIGLVRSIQRGEWAPHDYWLVSVEGGTVAKSKGYNPDIELAKGAKLQASSYDKTQKIKVTAGKVTVGGIPGVVEISGIATGKHDTSIDGTIDIWLSIFRYMRPDGTIDHVGGWNIPIALKPGQTAATTAKAFVKYINSGTRPYRAAAAGSKIKIVFTAK